MCFHIIAQVDCILSYAATHLMGLISQPGQTSKEILDTLRSDPRATKQALLLLHLYARTDTYALEALRAALIGSRWVV